MLIRLVIEAVYLSLCHKIVISLRAERRRREARREKFTHENSTLSTIHLGPAGQRPAWAKWWWWWWWWWKRCAVPEHSSQPPTQTRRTPSPPSPAYTWWWWWWWWWLWWWWLWWWWCCHDYDALILKPLRMMLMRPLPCFISFEYLFHDGILPVTMTQS